MATASALTSLKSKPGIISLIPGAAVAGDPRQRRAQHVRAKSEASLAGEHDGAKEEPKTKALGADVLIPGEPEQFRSKTIFRLA
ncbi:hypothetical protein AC630_39750 [Bradyrhizobium sp. AS23.2]|nr:hypothetical protein AC630_39750 [Bradyrhizobium sp. AS23.2]